MPSPLSSDTYKNLPSPADAAAVTVGLARWQDVVAACGDPALAARLREFAADPVAGRLLAALFGNSPFLAQAAAAEPELLLHLWHDGHEATFAELLARLNHDLKPNLPREKLMAELRRLKRRAALLIAIADIAGIWTVERVTGALTAFAEGALRLATRHVLAAAAAQGELELADSVDPARDSGFIVLAVGKLGAGELNYSSDIDLILIYDPERVRYRGTRAVQTCFTQIAQALVHILAERTADGYVFRTDLRMRPDPGSTPPALSLPAALSYYESTGQNWERAALIRARAVAGDLDSGARFLAALDSFLWRKHLDFAAIQDIHSIKRQIHAQKGGGTIAVAGHNIKLGRGGIREIEFFAQTQQLIWGGREPALRQRGTIEALNALAAAGHIAADAAHALAEAYRFLRRVEHRLQMIDDAQTHSIPADAEGLRRLAVFLGYPSSETLASELTRHLTQVESHYAHLFEETPSLSMTGNLVFTGSDDDPETLKTIAAFGFAEPPSVAAIIRGWHHGRYRSTRSQRARELLTELVPALLRAFGASTNPDVAFARFDAYLSRLPAGVQLFSLLYQNSGLLDLVAEIMGASPRLAETLAQRPGLIEGLLVPGFFDPLPGLAELLTDLAALLDRARYYEEVLDLARRWVGERKFQLGVQVLRHRLGGEAAGAGFADIAEAAIAQLLPRVTAEFVRAQGVIEDGALAVLGLGKLGSREMTFASDLDLILVYDAPPDVEASTGERPLPLATYYARLAQRFINALTAFTAEGNLYEVDMRLRPSGNSGPVASSFAAFRRYHQELAWTWERMALTRARAVAGDVDFRDRVMAEMRAVLTQRRDPQLLAADVAAMRQRIADSHRNPPFFEVKHRRGGMIDIEFIAQYLQLRDAARAPDVLRQNTRDALAALAISGALELADADVLREALLLWRNVQGLLKLTVDGPFEESVQADSLKTLLAKGAGAVDFAALKANMGSTAAHALRLYEALIEIPARRGKMAEESTP
ncbi:MAG TPA: bifunctional [glutamine synthetase] adenylyltransferase/[glutamine synthetase]-adenylyl-L-tyrosine phosphorylase [Stellaceae bacterium]|nr:bifunctional [glutamine synthetase] adenylyltransferase/[glutamine synthetase]-adenylyl-L-tyrosine phosphorylase [Stellaceae bacterium]